MQPAYDANSSDSDYLKRIEGFNHWRERCSGYDEPELKSARALLASDAADDGSSFQRAAKAIESMTSTADARARSMALRALFGARDPLLIDAAGLRIGLYRDDLTGPYFFFRGQKYDLRHDETMSAAVNLIPCGLGMNCDGHEGLVGLACAQSLGCQDSRFAAAPEALGRDADKIRLAMSLYEQLVQSIRAGATQDFVQSP